MNNLHIIQKQFVEVIASDVGDNFALQKETDALCRLKLIPGLDALLDKYGDTDEVIRIDKLFIEVDNISLTEFETILPERVLHKIDEALSEKIASGRESAPEPAFTILTREIELLVFYLQNGYLPWWSTVKNSADWRRHLDHLLSRPSRNADWSTLQDALNEQLVRERVSAEFTEKHFWALVEHLSDLDAVGLRADLSTFGKHSRRSYQEFDRSYRDVILRSIAHRTDLPAIYLVIAEQFVKEVKKDPLSSPISDELVKKIRCGALSTTLNQLLSASVNAAGPAVVPESMIKSAVKQDENKKLTDTADVSQDLPAFSKKNVRNHEIYIGDSGLAILAPYLPLFFNNLDVMIDKDGIKDVSKALALLHYLTYGEDDYAGFECVLAKVLCGIDLTEVVPKSSISRQEKKAVGDLLRAVIEHWQVLKKTSAKALQTSFLQRQGRLTFSNNEWNLKVHNESFDVLLSYLPWNIHMIKLPWMNHLLKVDWI